MLALVPAAAGAQSLAEVARMEAARRKAITQPGKLFTEKDLKPVPQPVTSGQVTVPASTPGPESTPKAVEPAAPAEAQQAEEDVKDEAWWRERITSARAALVRADTLIAALESRSNALLNDFLARDDPAQRAVLARERQAALDELARMKEERETLVKGIADIEEEARQAGVPPGWLRGDR